MYASHHGYRVPGVWGFGCVFKGVGCWVCGVWVCGRGAGCQEFVGVRGSVEYQECRLSGVRVMSVVGGSGGSKGIPRLLCLKRF